MIEGIIDGIFFNQGHVCCAGSRLLVQESVADEVLRRLIRRVDQLRVGDPLDKNTDVGAINSAAQLARIKELTRLRRTEGATRYTSSCALPDKGYWFAPTVFTDVSQSHRIAREEIFGPVLSVLTFRTPDEAVAKANNTNYGLACGVWSEKGSRTLWVAERLRAGVIWANTYNRFDPDEPLRRRARVGIRSRGRAPRTRGVPRCLIASTYARRTSSSSTAPSRVRSRAAATRCSTRGALPRQRRPRFAQGRARRRRGGARGPGEVVVSSPRTTGAR